MIYALHKSHPKTKITQPKSSSPAARKIRKINTISITQKSLTNPFTYSTKYEDSESRLLYYGYRFYNALSARWLNRDPIEEAGGLNIYGFVDNDGVNSWDYLGMYDFDIDDKAGTITMNYEIQVKFVDSSNWTQREKNEWVLKLKVAIEVDWNDKVVLVGKKSCKYKVRVNIITDTGISVDEDIEVFVEKSIFRAGVKSSIFGPVSMHLDQSSVELDSQGKTTAGHEFGHLIDLNHPNVGATPQDKEYDTPDGKTTRTGSKGDNIMGKGSKILPEHVIKWKKELDDERSKYAPFKAVNITQ